MKNKYLLIFIAILALSLFIRLIYLQQIMPTPVFGFYSADSQYHDKFAQDVVAGNLLFKDGIFVKPSYSVFLAVIYKIFGHKLLAVGLSQIIIDTLTGIFIYLICLTLFNKKSIGLTAFFLYSCYGLSIFYTAFILEATISAFLLTGCILAFLYAEKREVKSLWFLAGLLLGLFMLLRANALFLVPIIVLWIYAHRKFKFLQNSLKLFIFIVGVLLALGPFSLRNYLASDSLSPFPANGGINFYIGNHAGASGIYMPLKDISNSPVNQVKQSILEARVATGKDLRATDASKYWFKKGLIFARLYPAQFLSLTMKKAYLFLSATEFAVNEDYNFCKKMVPILRYPLFSFGILAPLAITGLVFAVRRKNRSLYLIALCIVGYMLSVIVFYISARYRFPIVPLIVVMASYALYEYYSLLKRVDIRELFIYSAIFIAMFSIVNAKIIFAMPPENLSINYNNMGVSLYRKGAIKEAISEYNKSIAVNSTYPGTYNNLAAAYYSLGNFDAAVKLYHKSLEINPNFIEALFGLGTSYSEIGDNQSAITMYKKTLELDPSYSDAYNNLAYIYMGLGDYEKAENVLNGLLSAEPKCAEAHNNLGIIYAKRGRSVEAIEQFKKALAIKPDYRDAKDNLSKALVSK